VLSGAAQFTTVAPTPSSPVSPGGIATFGIRFNPSVGGVRTALVSIAKQTVRLAGRDWQFAAGEPLITEYSVKYSPDDFLQLAGRAGWRGTGRWSDPAGDLSLHLLEPT
jgi:uncharacterized SAM-dependent methyltransferase